MGVNPARKNQNKYLNDPLLGTTPETSCLYGWSTHEANLRAARSDGTILSDEEYDKVHPRFFVSALEIAVIGIAVDLARKDIVIGVKYNQGVQPQAEFSVSNAIYQKISESGKQNTLDYNTLPWHVNELETDRWDILAADQG